MIDLHSHILPGLDDGPSTLAEAVAMARTAHAAGVEIAVATPHIREDYPFPVELIAARLDELAGALTAQHVELRVVAGGEVAISKVAELDDDTLRGLCLGPGPYVLVESPYSHATGLLESTLFDLQVRGFRPVLSHPERSPGFLAEPERLRALVERGVLCSVTAASVAGRFGGTVRRFALQLLEDGLGHNVASDAHDERRRPPLLSPAFESLEPRHRNLREAKEWLTVQVPAAILAGEEIPPRPLGAQRPTRLRRLLRRS